MHATTVAVDLAKSVFQLAVADDNWRVVENHRLTRTQFERWFPNREVTLGMLAQWPGHRSPPAPQGARTGVEAISRALADPQTPIPGTIHRAMLFLVEEIRLLELQIEQLERELAELAKHSPACTTLLSIPSVGLLAATAMVAATGGQVTHFQDARHFASWFGLTPREFSSGNSRVLGRISKKGDRYLRMLLTHGARAVLRAGTVARQAGRRLDGLRTWGLAVQARANHPALASRLIAHHGTPGRPLTQRCR